MKTQTYLLIGLLLTYHTSALAQPRREVSAPDRAASEQARVLLQEKKDAALAAFRESDLVRGRQLLKDSIPLVEGTPAWKKIYSQRLFESSFRLPRSKRGEAAVLAREAVDYLEQAIEETPDMLETRARREADLFVLATFQQNLLGDYVDAKEKYRAVLTLNPTHERAQKALDRIERTEAESNFRIEAAKRKRAESAQ